MEHRFTREQIESVQAGDLLAFAIEGEPTNFKPITRVIYRGKSRFSNKYYVGGYTRFSDNAEMSFSICEDDPTSGRLYRLKKQEG